MHASDKLMVGAALSVMGFQKDVHPTFLGWNQARKTLASTEDDETIAIFDALHRLAQDKKRI